MLQTIMDLLMGLASKQYGVQWSTNPWEYRQPQPIDKQFPVKEIEYLYKMEEELRRDALCISDLYCNNRVSKLFYYFPENYYNFHYFQVYSSFYFVPTICLIKIPSFSIFQCYQNVLKNSPTKALWFEDFFGV